MLHKGRTSGVIETRPANIVKHLLAVGICISS